MPSRAPRAILLAAGLLGASQALEARMTLNPVRKVVNLLQAMQKKVEQEGEAEKKLFEKFMCWCRTGDGDLSKSIEAAEEKAPAVTAAIEAAEGKMAQAKEDLKGAQTDRAAAKEAIAKATAVREKESAAFKKEKADADANLAATAKAVTAIEKGMAGGFLQTRTAPVLRRLVQTSDDLEDGDRQTLLAFLSSSAGYAPASGEIVGLLKQLQETMSKELAESVADEAAAVKSFKSLIAAKKKELAALTAAVETKTKTIGELGVQIVQMKEDLDDTAKGLLADKKFLKELETSCKTKQAEWDERSKLRSEELVALSDTVKILNDDDALSLFKKTLPSAGSSFIQMATSAVNMRSRALVALRAAHSRSHRAGLNFLLLALSGRKALTQGGFEKVIKMCDDMVAVLKQEQQDDDDKMQYCSKEFDQADDKKKGLERKVSDHNNAIAAAKEEVATMSDEIKALTAGIQELDKSVSSATAQRKSENSEFKDLIASNTAAKEVLAFAKNRLQKFYNPKLHKAAPKRELSEEGRIEASISGTEPPAEASFVQLSQEKDAPPPPPETFGAYSKKSEDSQGVLAMIDLLIKDLDKEMTEAKAEEKEAQKDYETMMSESAEKRKTDSQALSERESAKADVEAGLQAQKEAKAAAKKELAATLKFVASLHAECDWLVKYYDTRKEARSDEIDSVNKAKDILSGADYSLVQTRSHHFLRRGVA